MKGVNKLVMEIKSDGEYFEKALLFLKPGSNELTQKEISDGAEKLLKHIENKNNQERKKINIAYAFLWSGAGAFLMWITMLIFEYMN